MIKKTVKTGFLVTGQEVKIISRTDSEFMVLATNLTASDEELCHSSYRLSDSILITKDGKLPGTNIQVLADTSSLHSSSGIMLNPYNNQWEYWLDGKRYDEQEFIKIINSTFMVIILPEYLSPIEAVIQAAHVAAKAANKDEDNTTNYDECRFVVLQPEIKDGKPGFLKLADKLQSDWGHLAFTFEDIVRKYNEKIITAIAVGPLTYDEKRYFKDYDLYEIEEEKNKIEA